MSFHSRDNFNSNRKNIKTVKVSILVVFLLIIIFSFSWTRGLLFGVGSPFWNLKKIVIDSILYDSQLLISKKGLIKDNGLLRDQIAKSEKDKIILDLIKKENEDLKGILNRKSDKHNYILASVLVKPFLSAYDTLIIDIGTKDKINVGDKVLADGDSFIGYVSEVYANTSKVVLYSSFGEKIPVLIGANSIEKEAVGMGSGNYRVEMPREADIKEGDTIVSPSLNSNIFGVVGKIEFKATDSSQSVLFKSPINISELKWVEVIIN